MKYKNYLAFFVIIFSLLLNRVAGQNIQNQSPLEDSSDPFNLYKNGIAENSYLKPLVELHTKKGETHLIRRAIIHLEDRLDPEQFVRVHRSNIVNIDCVKSLHPLFSGDHLIILRDGTELNMSRTYHEKLMSLLDY